MTWIHYFVTGSSMLPHHREATERSGRLSTRLFCKMKCLLLCVHFIHTYASLDQSL